MKYHGEITSNTICVIIVLQMKSKDRKKIYIYNLFGSNMLKSLFFFFYDELITILYLLKNG